MAFMVCRLVKYCRRSIPQDCYSHFHSQPQGCRSGGTHIFIYYVQFVSLKSISITIHILPVFCLLYVLMLFHAVSLHPASVFRQHFKCSPHSLYVFFFLLKNKNKTECREISYMLSPATSPTAGITGLSV